MKEYLNKLPREMLSLIHLAGNLAAHKNMPVHLVGGFVRDLILGVNNWDLDIVVEGDGIIFAEELAQSLKAKLVRHRQFGTATVMLKGHHKIDIATARKEFYPKTAELPVVERGGLKDDLYRRDFTINAMAISLKTGKEFGKLIDSYGGRGDLENKKIRFLHALSFIDDPTRILRAIRFEQRYNFKIERQTLRFLKEAVELEMLEKVQPQRTRDDLILILKEREPLKEIKRMQELVGFGFIDKHLKVNKTTFSLLSSIKKEIRWFRKNYPNRRLLDVWLIYLMGLIDSLDIQETKSVCQKFAFHRGEAKRLLDLKKIKQRFITGLSKKQLNPSRIFAILEPLSYEAIVFLKAKYKNPILQQHTEEFLEIYNGMRIFINGKDLQGLGVRPGPSYQKIFAKVLKEKLEGKVKTREEELKLIKKIIRLRLA